MIRRVFVAALLSSVVAAGCSGSPAAGAAAAAFCGFTGTLPEAPPPSTSEMTIKQQAETQGLIALHSYLAPYVSGRTAVYKGTLSAHDNQSVLRQKGTNGKKLGDQTIPQGPAVAALSASGHTVTLSLHSVDLQEYVDLSQDERASSSTSIGIILPDNDGGGNTGPASGVPSFAGTPGSIDFPDVTSTQHVNLSFTGSHDVTLHTTVAASLTLAPPCSLQFGDVAQLNDGTTGLDFRLRGLEYVATLKGYAYSNQQGCSAEFSIELFVDASNLTSYGVRNFKIVTNGNFGGGCAG